MPNLHVQLLGGFQLTTDARILREPHAIKARALLAYLVLQDGRSVSRDLLANLLWSYSDHERARHSLSQALSSIRRVFDAAAVDGLELAKEDVRLDIADLDVDTHAFGALAVTRELHSLEQAAALYKGDLLDGLHINEPGFQAWLRAEHERLNETAVAVLSAVSEAQARNNRLDDAIITALKLLSLNPLHEQTHRGLMRYHAKQGRADAALMQFKSLERLLEWELGVQPDAESRRLTQTIKQKRKWKPPKPVYANNEDRCVDDRPSIIVLPFLDYSDDRDPDHFADGLTDDLIGDLSRIGGLLVIARNTSFRYKNRSVNVRQIAQKLGIQYVLEGSVHRSCGRVRVNVQFPDGGTETLIWSDRFERDIENVFLLQNEITGRIASSLRLEMLQAESRMRQEPPANLTAWSLALRGWSALWTHNLNGESYQTASRFIETSLELDSSQSLAWAALDSRCVFGWRDQREKAAEALSQIDAIDNQLTNINQFARQYQHVRNNEFAIEGLLRARMPEK